MTAFSRNYEERRLPVVAKRLNALLAMIDRAEHGEHFAVLWREGTGADAHERIARLFEELEELITLRERQMKV